MFRAEVTVEQGGSLADQRLRSPVPNRGYDPIVPRIEGCSKISGRPGAMVLPRLNSMHFVAVKTTNHIAGWRRRVSGAGATRPISYFRPLRDVVFLAPPVGPGAGSHQAREDAPFPLATVRQHVG